MTPLIDADILLHEIGWSGEFKDKESGEMILLDWEYVQELLEKKIEGICEDVDATKPPILFISNSDDIVRMWNRLHKYDPDALIESVPNFRYEVATTKPYKGTRKNPKPHHFYNLVAHMLTHYNTVVSDNGLEADDMMGLYQTSHEDTIICSRDKDLRIVPGWHFSWECGGQRALGPVEADEIGWIELLEKQSTNRTTGKVTTFREIRGYGLKFFFSQMITGDTADNIPGLPKQGAVKAYNLLNPLATEEEMFKAVQSLYKEIMGERAKEYFHEMKSLLWMKQTDKWEYKFGETKRS